MRPSNWNGAARNGYPGSFSLIHVPSDRCAHCTGGPPGPKVPGPSGVRDSCALTACTWAADKVSRCPSAMATIEVRYAKSSGSTRLGTDADFSTAMQRTANAARARRTSARPRPGEGKSFGPTAPAREPAIPAAFTVSLTYYVALRQYRPAFWRETYTSNRNRRGAPRPAKSQSVTGGPADVMPTVCELHVSGQYASDPTVPRTVMPGISNSGRAWSGTGLRALAAFL